ncbi:MAG: sulfite exporter TauE/SafE family protein [Candidatus Binatia bacterium]
MDFSTLYLLIFSLGLGISILSGMVGIGGGIIMAPALLYIPPLLQVGQLDMKTVTGLTITQGVFACLSGAFRHNKYKFVSRHLVFYMGIPILIGASSGAVFSKYVREELLLALFASLALVAAILMLIARENETNTNVPGNRGELVFSKPLAVMISLVTGFLVGMVGQGGSFILIPLMLFVLNIPMRLALGSNLAIVSLSSLAGFVGKLSTGQVPFPLALALIIGSLPGAQVGSFFSKQTNPSTLKYLLALIVALAALRMWFQVLWGR